MNIFKQAVSKYKANNQLDKLIEELAELIQATVKLKHNQSQQNLYNFLEEIADVSILLKQTPYILEELKIDKEFEYINIYQNKINKLKYYLKNK